MYIRTGIASQLAAFLTKQSYWSVRLKGGEVLCELDEVIDVRNGTKRRLSWHEDVVLTRKHLTVTDIQLRTPRTRISYTGNVATLAVTRPASCFVLNGRSSLLFEDRGRPTYQIIGRVTDRTGACECFVYDALLDVLGTPFITNVCDFGAWRVGVSPLGPLALGVLGLEL